MTAPSRRLPKWRAGLTAVIRDASQRPFEWGSADCCMGLAFPAVKAVCGLDMAAPFVGQYSTALGALLALRKQGYAGVIELFEATLTECPVPAARVGDVVGIKNEDGDWAMGIVIGARAAVLRHDGYGTVDLLKCNKAFRVG